MTAEVAVVAVMIATKIGVMMVASATILMITRMTLGCRTVGETRDRRRRWNHGADTVTKTGADTVTKIGAGAIMKRRIHQ